MKNKQIRILLFMSILTLSMILTQTPIALEQEDAVTIVLQEKNIILYSPFDITRTMMFRDGGTIAIVIEDGMGISLPCCLDSRINRPSKLRHLYIGATHPSKPKAKTVPIASAAEKAILTILKHATITEPGPNAREDLVEIVIEELENR
jgi:hypothetical protein